MRNDSIQPPHHTNICMSNIVERGELVVYILIFFSRYFFVYCCLCLDAIWQYFFFDAIKMCDGRKRVAVPMVFWKRWRGGGLWNARRTSMTSSYTRSSFASFLLFQHKCECWCIFTGTPSEGTVGRDGSTAITVSTTMALAMSAPTVERWQPAAWWWRSKEECKTKWPGKCA